MRPMFIMLAVLGLATTAGAAGAQSGYARSVRDTIRYHEVTSSVVRVTTPQGDVVIPIDVDAIIGVVLLPGDTARAWFDSLRLSTTPRGRPTVTPETGALLGRPFVLTVDSRGRANLAAAPIIPDGIRQVTDLTHHFDDFFIRLPAQPLVIGLAWADTSSRSGEADGKTLQLRSIANYRVERDTTVGGEAAMVIRATQQSSVTTEGPVPGQPMRVQSRITGGDEGFFVFSKSGRMLARQRMGRTSGETVMRGAAGSVTLKQTMSFTSRVEVVR